MTTDDFTFFCLKHGLRNGHLVIHRCVHSLSFLCVRGSRVSIVVTGGVDIGTAVGTKYPLASGADMSLLTGLEADVHFTGEEPGMRWEDCIFELQAAVEWKAVTWS